MNDILGVLCAYVTENYATTYTVDTLPKEKSLIELGILDSFGIIELISFIEENWSISIEDDAITKENFGSINAMVNFVKRKTNA